MSSCVESFISTTSSIVTDASDQESSQLQRCIFFRDLLGLDFYKSKPVVASVPHVKISSKTLKECYTLPGNGSDIDNVFVKLAEFMHSLSLDKKKPPRTDFTCLSRLEQRKVFLDIDCIMCKSGNKREQKIHFGATQLLKYILNVVAKMFNETVTEGVYLTNGSRSCGYHMFFNTLTYGANGVTESSLMDALDKALKESTWNKVVAIDRGCTQMPFPTCLHANSSHRTIPYEFKINDNEFRRQRMKWIEMDAETLKGFSTISIPKRYNKSGFDNILCPMLVDVNDDDGDDGSIDMHAFGNRKRSVSVVEDDCDRENGYSPPKRKCMSQVNVSVERPFKVFNRKLETPATRQTPDGEDRFYEDDGSLLSVDTEETAATSFMGSTVRKTANGGVSIQMPPPRSNEVKQTVAKRRQKETPFYDREPPGLTNTIKCLPYACESDKFSAFVDKQYKAMLLCAEESDAEACKACLQQEQVNNNDTRQRVYVVSGSSVNLTREYQLLVQLVNVKRSVYGDDVFARRAWTDLLLAYYNQHLHNPFTLEILRFVFKEMQAKHLFSHHELVDLNNSIVQLMAPFKLDKEKNVSLPMLEKQLEEQERYDREIGPHKCRLVGALIRVCTHLFGMVTAILSDLNNVQKRKERTDLTLLNCTVVDKQSELVHRNKTNNGKRNTRASVMDDDLDCSASMSGDDKCNEDELAVDKTKYTTYYALLASLIVHEQSNLSDQALYAFLYYYHNFPAETINRIINEVHQDGLMVTAMIQLFLMYDHSGKPLSLKEIIRGFNDVAISLTGVRRYLFFALKKNKKRKNSTTKNGTSVKTTNNPNAIRRFTGDDDSSNSSSNCPSYSGNDDSDETAVTEEEMRLFVCAADRKRLRVMCCTNIEKDKEYVKYDWEYAHYWQTAIGYYLRPVLMHEDRLVFANDTYDTLEDDAIDSCLAHIISHPSREKLTKADVAIAFKDARTVWRMAHGSQLVYESDLKSNILGCRFHINVSLKIYEMYCGGCITQMRRVHKNYLIDRTRFNMSVYDVVAECRTATINLTSDIDRSYMHLLLYQPVVPPFLEEEMDVRQLFMSNEEIRRGSFCCLSLMDYIRAMNLFERSNCLSRPEVKNCEYVETFLDDLFTNEIAADRPPNPKANAHVRQFYTFYSLYLYEVVFNMRHAYVRRENCHVSIERLCYELDVRQLLILFFGESSMRRVQGLTQELETVINQTANGLSTSSGSAFDNTNNETANQSANARFDVRPVLSMEIPDKIMRIKALFGQFGFDVMQDNVGETAAGGSTDEGVSNDYGGDNNTDNVWKDEGSFEKDFYVNDDWFKTVYERIGDAEINGKTERGTTALPIGSLNNCAQLFARETVNTIMRLELKRHIDHDRLGKLATVQNTNGQEWVKGISVMKQLPMRIKMLAFILTAHTIKSKTKTLANDFVEATYRAADGCFADERRVYEGEVNAGGQEKGEEEEPPEKLWCRRTETLLDDRRSQLLHLRWLADQRFKRNFFVGLNPEHVYDELYNYMQDNQDQFPAFKTFNDNQDTALAARNLCTAMMYLLVMSSYDQEHVDLYLKLFLAVEWPGQWAKTIFVWKSNSNGGKSYFFDAIIKRACATSTCINDPKGGKENAPEKAEYVRNFVLFANEFSQANSNELKKLVSESTFKFRMNYGNVMNEAYATGKIMFNCNTLPPTSDEAAINRLTLFNIPFWFCKRQRISDAMLNWIRGFGQSDCTRWEMACRYKLPDLLTDEEKCFFETHSETKNEADLFDGYAAIRPNMIATDFSKATSSLFMTQNKTSRLYVASSPPTDRIVHGLVNITSHFSWLRFFKRIDTPVDFATLPATSEGVRSEWLGLTLPYKEWKQITGAKPDPSGRVPAETINRSLQAFASKKNVNYFGIKQFFETDFASSREAIKDEYCMWFNPKGVGE